MKRPEDYAVSVRAGRNGLILSVHGHDMPGCVEVIGSDSETQRVIVTIPSGLIAWSEEASDFGDIDAAARINPNWVEAAP